MTSPSSLLSLLYYAVAEHFGAAEASMQAEYGIDLRKALWGRPEERIGSRRLASLMYWLPPDSALVRSMNPKGWAWTQETEIQAALLEVTDRLLAVTEAVNAKDGDGRLRKTVEVPRPWDEAAKTPMSSKAEIDAFVAKYGGKRVHRTHREGRE